jgi:hypothetical protein
MYFPQLGDLTPLLRAVQIGDEEQVVQLLAEVSARLVFAHGESFFRYENQ